jgi:hypothetical protein
MGKIISRIQLGKVADRFRSAIRGILPLYEPITAGTAVFHITDEKFAHHKKHTPCA